jgi:hypothetical protein
MDPLLIILAIVNLILFIVGLGQQKKRWLTITLNGVAAITCFIVAFIN